MSVTLSEKIVLEDNVFTGVRLSVDRGSHVTHCESDLTVGSPLALPPHFHSRHGIQETLPNPPQLPIWKGDLMTLPQQRSQLLRSIIGYLVKLVNFRTSPTSTDICWLFKQSRCKRPVRILLECFLVVVTAVS